MSKLTIREPYVSVGESDAGKWIRCDIHFAAGGRHGNLAIRRYSSYGLEFGFEAVEMTSGLDDKQLWDLWSRKPADGVLMPDGKIPTKKTWSMFIATLQDSAREHINAALAQAKSPRAT